MGPDVLTKASGGSTEAVVFSGENSTQWEQWKEMVGLRLCKYGEGIAKSLWEWKPGDQIVDSKVNMTKAEAKAVVDEHYWYTANSLTETKRKLFQNRI